MSTAPDAGQTILDRIAARQVALAKLEAETAADMLEFDIAEPTHYDMRDNAA